MRDSIIRSVLVALCVALVGCVKDQFGPELEYDVVEEPRAQMEAIPPQVELLQLVRNTPTEFIVPVPDSRYAWERAELFFRKHTGESRFSAGKGDSVVLSNTGKGERIRYSVERRPLKNGTKFSINCSTTNPKVAKEELNIQCRNLARFVRDGVLEESFIYNEQ